MATWQQFEREAPDLAAEVRRVFTAQVSHVLATVRREHVCLRRGAVVFSYPAKGGIPRSVALRDPLLHRLVGTARVVIGTGTSDRKGRDRLILDGLPMGAAAALRAELLHRAPSQATAPSVPSVPSVLSVAGVPSVSRLTTASSVAEENTSQSLTSTS